MLINCPGHRRHKIIIQNYDSWAVDAYQCLEINLFQPVSPEIVNSLDRVAVVPQRRSFGNNRKTAPRGRERARPGDGDDPHQAPDSYRHPVLNRPRP